MFAWKFPIEIIFSKTLFIYLDFVGVGACDEVHFHADERIFWKVYLTCKGVFCSGELVGRKLLKAGVI